MISMYVCTVLRGSAVWNSSYFACVLCFQNDPIYVKSFSWNQGQKISLFHEIIIPLKFITTKEVFRSKCNRKLKWIMNCDSGARLHYEFYCAENSLFINRTKQGKKKLVSHWSMTRTQSTSTHIILITQIIIRFYAIKKCSLWLNQNQDHTINNTCIGKTEMQFHIHTHTTAGAHILMHREKYKVKSVTVWITMLRIILLNKLNWW